MHGPPTVQGPLAQAPGTHLKLAPQFSYTQSDLSYSLRGKRSGLVKRSWNEKTR